MLTLKKGVNLGGFLSQCSEYTTEHYETFITESDLDTIVDLKFDHIRLPIDYEVIEHEEARSKRITVSLTIYLNGAGNAR